MTSKKRPLSHLEHKCSYSTHIHQYVKQKNPIIGARWPRDYYVFPATMNPGHRDAELLTGADIRRYRKSIGHTQVEFAERMGVSQSALSLMESGRIAVSEDHVDQLKERFRGREVKRAFTDFLTSLKATRAAAGASLATSTGRYLTLTVWRWEDGFDLGGPPAPEMAVNVVTIRATDKPTIAFQMPRVSPHWAKDEILVFEECGPSELKDGDICLVGAVTARSCRLRTTLGVAHLGKVRRMAPQIQPLAPKGAPVAANAESMRTLLRVSFRVRAV